jgi:hypothetical protein
MAGIGHLIALSFAAIIAATPLAAIAAERLNVSMPGADLEPYGAKWYAISLEGKELVITPVNTHRTSEWTTISIVKSEKSTETAKALNLPQEALFAISDPDGSVGAGRYASILDAPMTLRAGMAFQLGGNWVLGTEHKKRPDGDMLAGSLSLVATNRQGLRQVVLPPASGMAFARQELLWLGRTKQGGGWDALVRRTWLTGESEYVLAVGGALALAVADSDRPITKFSLGIEESEVESRHAAQKHEAPAGKFGIAAFSIEEAVWNVSLDKAVADAKPATLFDRKLMLAVDQIRFTADYIPRWQASDGDTHSGNADTWAGPVLLRAYYRGASQPLLEIGALDGNALRVQVGTISGKPAIEVSYQPHYNNILTYHWIWNEELRRFQRLSRYHVQGC